MKRLALTLAVISLAWLAGCSTLLPGGHPTLDRLEKNGTLRVGMTGEQPPFNMLARSGEIIGLEADLAKALALSMGLEAELVQLPFSELLPALEKGDIDMVMSGMTMTPERNRSNAFAGPYFISGKAILTSDRPLASADDPGDINQAGLRLAALASSTSEGFIREAVPEATFVPIENYDTGVEMVKAGRVDAMVADYPICVLSVLRNPGLATMVSPFTFEPLGIALPGDDPLFVNLVQNYMTMLEGTGLLDELRSKWLDDPSWLALLP